MDVHSTRLQMEAEERAQIRQDKLETPQRPRRPRGALVDGADRRSPPAGPRERISAGPAQRRGKHLRRRRRRRRNASRHGTREPEPPWGTDVGAQLPGTRSWTNPSEGQ
ncbi:unnamed protein product [Lota lota]